MKHGDIRWYRFTQPDKTRPVLVLTRDSVIPYLNEITVAPITSTVRGIRSEVSLSASDGMPRECAINFDHLQTVSKSKIGGLICTLPTRRLSEARTALLFALGLES